MAPKANSSWVTRRLIRIQADCIWDYGRDRQDTHAQSKTAPKNWLKFAQMISKVLRMRLYFLTDCLYILTLAYFLIDNRHVWIHQNLDWFLTKLIFFLKIGKPIFRGHSLSEKRYLRGIEINREKSRLATRKGHRSAKLYMGFALGQYHFAQVINTINWPQQ